MAHGGTQLVALGAAFLSHVASAKQLSPEHGLSTQMVPASAQVLSVPQQSSPSFGNGSLEMMRQVAPPVLGMPAWLTQTTCSLSGQLSPEHGITMGVEPGAQAMHCPVERSHCLFCAPQSWPQGSTARQVLLTRSQVSQAPQPLGQGVGVRHSYVGVGVQHSGVAEVQAHTAQTSFAAHSSVHCRSQTRYDT